jgi:hypothetical protein
LPAETALLFLSLSKGDVPTKIEGYESQVADIARWVIPVFTKAMTQPSLQLIHDMRLLEEPFLTVSSSLSTIVSIVFIGASTFLFKIAGHEVSQPVLLGQTWRRIHRAAEMKFIEPLGIRNQNPLEVRFVEA